MHAAMRACAHSPTACRRRSRRAEGELVARLGGEEFGVLLRDASLQQALERAEGFRARLAADPMDAGADAAVALSVSIGVAAFHPHRHHDADALYHAADSALYDAKAAGRNRVGTEGDVASPSR